MFRQVGPELILGGPDGATHVAPDAGLARRGMIVRHLVLPADRLHPQGLAGTADALRWIATRLSPQIHVSLMNQYFPAYRCVDDPVLGRKVTEDEYVAALDALEAAGLENGWVQEFEDE
jgi:putative pyruvate formate lyase activating enzyme